MVSLGMDPAGPSFESNADLTIGLNPGSANFVDVLHTDTSTYGTLRDIGHADFYPAGGHDQPGCVCTYLILTVSDVPRVEGAVYPGWHKRGASIIYVAFAL